MKSLFAAILFGLLSTTAFAGLDKGEVLSCTNDQTLNPNDAIKVEVFWLQHPDSDQYDLYASLRGLGLDSPAVRLAEESPGYEGQATFYHAQDEKSMIIVNYTVVDENNLIQGGITLREQQRSVFLKCTKSKL